MQNETLLYQISYVVNVIEKRYTPEQQRIKQNVDLKTNNAFYGRTSTSDLICVSFAESFQVTFDELIQKHVLEGGKNTIIYLVL